MRRPRGDRLLVGAAALLVTAGLIVVAVTAAGWLDKVHAAGQAQARLAARWASGAGVARLHLPTLRLTLVVVEGSGPTQLATGPGHITGTSAAGGPNTGIAAHRYPGLFWDLDRLRDGDPVLLETRTEWYAYRVTRSLVVDPAAGDVLTTAGPLPILTLVTCEPKLSTARRLIRQAELVRRQPRSGELPAELVGHTGS